MNMSRRVAAVVARSAVSTFSLEFDLLNKSRLVTRLFSSALSAPLLCLVFSSNLHHKIRRVLVLTINLTYARSILYDAYRLNIFSIDLGRRSETEIDSQLSIALF